MKQIIVCDDDLEIAESLSLFLQDDYKVFECHNGKEALDCLNKNHIDLMVMDIMMPGEDGLKTVARIRDDGNNVPVIFLSAKSEDTDKITGLNIGGDDYMTKPFNPLELKARVKSVLKRSSITNDKKEKNVYKTGNLKINKTTKTVTLSNKELKFTPIEFNILVYFMKNLGKVLSSNDIYKEVWNESAAFNIENTVAVHIRHIREKIEKNSKEPKYIKVVWGIGYKMEEV